MARNRFFRAAASFVEYVGVETEHGAYLVSTADTNVGRALVTKRQRKEHRKLTVAVDLLAAAGIDGRGTLLDVGANIGTTVVPALLEHGFERGLAFEPEPMNFRLLRANLALNGLEDRVGTYRTALSDHAGEALLVVSSPNSGSYWLASESEDADGRRVSVRTERLDDALAAAGVEPEAVDLLWMDVEGHEAHVLAGCPSLLARPVPTVLEFSPEDLRRAGGLDLLLEQLASSFTLVHDLRQPRDDPFEAARLEPLLDRYANWFTDLLCIGVDRPAG